MLLLILAAAASWVQTSHVDRMRGETVKTATLQAENGRAIVVVTNRDNHAFAGLSVPGSKLDCIARCSVLVKFGGEPARYVRASGSSPNGMIFETSAVDAIKAAKSFDVEVRFLRGGSFQYHFSAVAPLSR
ncbi:hypothetical protein [Sphingomonas hankookensis]|uniref:hypothetical protein n=1 Tax=Sphingomonas hankookensis TaxID=563996 RepID=UPI003D301893